MRKVISGAAAVLSLAACLAAPIAYFLGALDEGTYRQLFAAASLAWFVTATVFATSRGK
jgi:hypothetical protein